MKASQLSLTWPIPVLSKDLVLVKEYLVTVLAGDEPVALAVVEPSDRAALLGQRSSLSKAPRAQHGDVHPALHLLNEFRSDGATTNPIPHRRQATTRLRFNIVVATKTVVRIRSAVDAASASF